MNFYKCLQGEFLKLRHTSILRTILICALTGHMIALIMYLMSPLKAQSYGNSAQMGITIVYPIMCIGVILLVNITSQIESRNNTWKQVILYPNPYGYTYFSKLATNLILFIATFLVGLIAAYVLTFVIDLIVLKKLSLTILPAGSFSNFLKSLLVYVLAALSVIALQFVLSSQFRNAATPLWIGLALWAIPKSVISSYALFIPYQYFGLIETATPGHSIFWSNKIVISYSLAFFIMTITIGYVLEAKKLNRAHLMKKNVMVILIGIALAFLTIFGINKLTTLNLPPAATVIAEGTKRAIRERKNVFVICQSSSSGQQMTNAVNDKTCKRLLEENYIIIYIDAKENAARKELENPGADAVLSKYKFQGALPFWFLLNPEGKMIANSISPITHYSVGFPGFSTAGLTLLGDCLKKSSTMTDGQIEVVKSSFKKNIVSKNIQ